MMKLLARTGEWKQEWAEIQYDRQRTHSSMSHSLLKPMSWPKSKWLVATYTYFKLKSIVVLGPLPYEGRPKPFPASPSIA